MATEAAYILETNLLIGADYYEPELKTAAAYGYKSKLTTATSFGGLDKDIIRTGCEDGSGATIPCEAIIFNLEVATGRAHDTNEGFKLILIEPGHSGIRLQPFSKIIMTPKRPKIEINNYDPNTGDIISTFDSINLEKRTVGSDKYYAVVPNSSTGHTGRIDQVLLNLFRENLGNQITLEFKCYI